MLTFTGRHIKPKSQVFDNDLITKSNVGVLLSNDLITKVKGDDRWGRGVLKHHPTTIATSLRWHDMMEA